MHIVTFIAVVVVAIFANSSQAAEKLRVAYPAIAPGSTPSWVTADKGLWRKYGFDVEPILVSGGARAVPADAGIQMTDGVRHTVGKRYPD